MSQIHYFNPGHENAVLNRSPSYMPPKNMQILMHELASLCAWYGEEMDVVLVSDDYDKSYFIKLNDLGIYLSSLLYKSELIRYNKSKLNSWGVTPHVIKFFDNLNKEYKLNLKLPDWDDKYIYLNSRLFSLDILRQLIESASYFDRIKLPTLHTNLESIGESILENTSPMLVKSPFSSSGRGLLWLPKGRLTRVENQIIQGMLNKQTQVLLEPVYSKVLDFAMEFMSDGVGNVSFVGYSLFLTNDKGAYQGNILCSQLKIEAYILQYIDVEIINEIKFKLTKLLIEETGAIYSGCIGVDMMVCEEEECFYLHPCVEINLRYNMGYLALKLYEKYIHPASEGKYFLDFDKTGRTYFTHQQMQKDYPLIVENGRVKSGYLSLCPVFENTKYRAYILVDEL